MINESSRVFKGFGVKNPANRRICRDAQEESFDFVGFHEMPGRAKHAVPNGRNEKKGLPRNALKVLIDLFQKVAWVFGFIEDETKRRPDPDSVSSR
jgi:hypothetical protein